MPADQLSHQRSFNHDAEIVPAVSFRRIEIAALDVEAANHRARFIGDGHFLMVADQIPPPEARGEDLITAPGLAQCLEKRRAFIGRGPKAVDDQARVHSARCRRRQRITDGDTGVVIGEDVIAQAQACLCAADQIEQRSQPVLPAGVEGQRLPLGRHPERRLVAVYRQRWG